MMDLITASLTCDLTRVVTFMMGNGQSYQQFPFLGVTGEHHVLSHHQNNPELIAANEGLGYLIIFAQRTFNPTLMFAGVLTVSTMGFIADRLLQALGRRLFRWQEQAER